jgi:predicted RNA-binding protein (virulence factor B family)
VERAPARRGGGPLIHVGQYNTLEARARVAGGWMLHHRDAEVFLPDRLAPPDLALGASLRVFVYTDATSRIATTKTPAGTVGDFVCLEVVAVSAPGAFCSWGIDKDLLIPAHKQVKPLRVGDRPVVALLLDRDDRVMGSTYLNQYLRNDTRRFSPGQEVDLLAYAYAERGISVVVQRQWGGMLFYDRTHRDVKIGEQLRGFVRAIRPDGRLDVALTPERGADAAHADDVAVITRALAANGGFLRLTDDSDPAAIRDALHLSKKAFKRAVGTLYREHKVTLEAEGIRWRSP